MVCETHDSLCVAFLSLVSWKRFPFQCNIFVHISLKGIWVKAMIPVLRCGSEAVEVLKRTEARGGDRLSPHTFTCLEAIHHPDNHQALAQVTNQLSFGWFSILN